MNHRDDNFDDHDHDDDTKLLIQKAWCHGQSIAPPLLGGMAVFTSSPKHQSWFESVVILTIVTSWPIVSWRSMQRPSSSSLRRIWIGGVVLLSMYANLLGSMALQPGDASTGMRILLMVFIALMIVETMAYLAVVWYHRSWFERGLVRHGGAEGEAINYYELRGGKRCNADESPCVQIRINR